MRWCLTFVDSVIKKPIVIHEIQKILICIYNWNKHTFCRVHHSSSMEHMATLPLLQWNEIGRVMSWHCWCGISMLILSLKIPIVVHKNWSENNEYIELKETLAFCRFCHSSSMWQHCHHCGEISRVTLWFYWCGITLLIHGWSVGELVGQGDTHQIHACCGNRKGSCAVVVGRTRPMEASHKCVGNKQLCHVTQSQISPTPNSAQSLFALQHYKSDCQIYDFCAPKNV